VGHELLFTGDGQQMDRPFSGITVFGIGLWLFITRLVAYKNPKPREHHEHEHEHEHDHDHDHAHHHHHHHPAEHHFSFWNNILLGISGGIIPCPKAIVILLLAISLQKITLGIVIITVFSMGLAAVLFTIGLIMVKAAHLLKNRLTDRRLRLLPVLASVIIFGLGVFIGVRALLML
jgi:nickel/cobalt transporter (NicO) family protein